MIAVTNHARQRVRERLGIKNKWKALRLAKRAINQGVIPEEKHLKLIKMGFQTYVYKEFDENIFVFQKNPRDIVLITVYPK